MKCPFCNQELQHGVIQSMNGIFWLESPVKFPMKPSKKNAEHISVCEGIRDIPYIYGYRCFHCNWILIQPQ